MILREPHTLANEQLVFIRTALRYAAPMKTEQLIGCCLNSSAWLKARERAGASLYLFDCREPMIDSEIREHFLRVNVDGVVQKAIATTVNSNGDDNAVVVVFHAGHAYSYYIGKGERLTVSGNEPDDPEFIDRVGGSHSGGVGNAPDGTFCGECTYGSCENCPVWERIRASKSGKV